MRTVEDHLQGDAASPQAPPPATPERALGKAPRRYDVDWLRVIAVCGLIMIHTAAMFDPFPPTAVKGESCFPLILFSTFLHEWRLAILFLVSGASSYFALGFLTARQFVGMRFKRIIIPLVVGTMLIVPIHLYYLQFLGNPGYPKSYLQFYATIMRGFFGHGNFGNITESLHWGHLWFLAYLFVSSLVSLPLFLYLKGEKGRRLTQRLTTFMEKRWAIFYFALPLIFVEATLRAKWYVSRLILIHDWANFFFYLVVFIYGFIIFSDVRMRKIIERHRWPALLAAVIASTIFMLMTFTGMIPTRGYNLRWTLFMGLRGFNIWFWCVTVLGFGSKYLDFKNRLLLYATEAVYPVYVIHLPIATAIAYRVVHWGVPAGLQFTIIFLSTLAVSVLIYDLLIRRTKVTRFLFGLKVKKSERPALPLPAPQRADARDEQVLAGLGQPAAAPAPPAK